MDQCQTVVTITGHIIFGLARVGESTYGMIDIRRSLLSFVFSYHDILMCSPIYDTGFPLFPALAPGRECTGRDAGSALSGHLAMLLAAAQGPALPSSLTPTGATSLCRSVILWIHTTRPTAGLTTWRARFTDNATGGALHIGYDPYFRDASDTSYIRRPRFKGCPCPTSKAAPVSGGGTC